jgi:hypothetical protein
MAVIYQERAATYNNEQNRSCSADRGGVVFSFKGGEGDSSGTVIFPIVIFNLSTVD